MQVLDDTKHADRIVVDMIRRRDNAAIVENAVSRLLAYEYSYAVSIDAPIQQIEDQAFVRKRLEYAP